MEFSLSHTLALLARTPATLAALLDGMPEEWTGADEGGESWSAQVVVAHLLHAERTLWIPRARAMRRHGRAQPLPPFDREGHASHVAVPVPERLASFAEARAQSLETLEGWALDGAALAVRGEHPEFGTVTLAQLLAAWTVHDLAHLAQVSRVLAKQYREAVGPWRAYLRVLDR